MNQSKNMAGTILSLLAVLVLAYVSLRIVAGLVKLTFVIVLIAAAALFIKYLFALITKKGDK